MNRNLDGCYFRIKRGDRYYNICFSDLTDEEMDNVLNENRDIYFYKSMCKRLAHSLKEIGDHFDICAGATND